MSLTQKGRFMKVEKGSKNVKETYLWHRIKINLSKTQINDELTLKIRKKVKKGALVAQPVRARPWYKLTPFQRLFPIRTRS